MCLTPLGIKDNDSSYQTTPNIQGSVKLSIHTEYAFGKYNLAIFKKIFNNI